MNKNVILGAVIALIVVSVYYLESTKSEVDNTPVEADIKIEDIQTQVQPQDAMKATEPETPMLSDADQARIAEKADKHERAKELVSPEGYLNTDPITIAGNIGKKVILVDFWTYSCINCQRTLPFLNTWWEKYQDEGLLIIGVHTPEFEFEKDYDNLQAAIEKYGIEYPVVQDNDRETWRAYKNRYWPRKYLIDIDGFIVYDHIGEGAYDETEKKIQELLEERKQVLGDDVTVSQDLVDVEEQFVASGKTPEIYFGWKYERDQFGNEKGYSPGTVVEYSMPADRERDKFYLSGSWKNNQDNMEVIDYGVVKLNWKGRSINLVAGSENPATVKVELDGEMSEIDVSEFDLYSLGSFEKNEEHELKLIVPEGVMLYTFTFG